MLSHAPRQTAFLRNGLELLLLCLAFFLAFHIRSSYPLPLLGLPRPLELLPHVWLLSIALPLYWALSNRNATWPRNPYSVRAVAIPFVYLGLLLGTAIFLFQAKTFSRAVFFLFLALACAFVAAARWLVKIGGSRLHPAVDFEKNLLIVGVGVAAQAFRRRVESQPGLHIRVVGHLCGPDESAPVATDTVMLGNIDDLKVIVEEQVVDDVVFVVSPVELIRCEEQVAWCDEVGVTVHLMVDFVRKLVAKTYPSELDGIPVLTVASTPRDAGNLLLKRTTDVLVGGIALVALAPVFLLTAIAIKLTSRGPVFFSQERVGLNGRLFRLHKFRSMYRDAELRRAQVEPLNEMRGPVFKIERDPRITPVGRWIRRFSIDELPQLWDVLRGQMSLVGPRPPLASEVRQYQRWQRRRLSMKPGITCLWQVNGRNRIQFEDWMKLDLEYIDNWSLGLDLKILLRTIPAVMLARGAR